MSFELAPTLVVTGRSMSPYLEPGDVVDVVPLEANHRPKFLQVYLYSDGVQLVAHAYWRRKKNVDSEMWFFRKLRPNRLDIPVAREAVVGRVTSVRLGVIPLLRCLANDVLEGGLGNRWLQMLNSRVPRWLARLYFAAKWQLVRRALGSVDAAWLRHSTAMNAGIPGVSDLDVMVWVPAATPECERRRLADRARRLMRWVPKLEFSWALEERRAAIAATCTPLELRTNPGLAERLPDEAGREATRAERFVFLVRRVLADGSRLARVFPLRRRRWNSLLRVAGIQRTVRTAAELFSVLEEECFREFLSVEDLERFRRTVLQPKENAHWEGVSWTLRWLVYFPKALNGMRWGQYSLEDFFEPLSRLAPPQAEVLLEWVRHGVTQALVEVPLSLEERRGDWLFYQTLLGSLSHGSAGAVLRSQLVSELLQRDLDQWGGSE